MIDKAAKAVWSVIALLAGLVVLGILALGVIVFILKIVG